MPQPSPLPIVNSPHQFSYENGVEVTKVAPDFAEGVLRAGPNTWNPFGHIHGGALATLTDTVCGCCACSRGGSCVTASCSMEFLRPASGPEITCTATPKKMGRTLSVIQAELRDAAGVLVVTATYTFFMVPDSTQRADA